MLSTDKYLDKIESYLNNLIDDRKAQGEWKIQLTMAINFISTNDSDETSAMHTKSDNVEIMIGIEKDEIMEKRFNSPLQRYLKNLEESMKGSKFVFDSVDLLYYKLHKISLNRSGSYADSPKWLKHEKPTLNPKNNDDKCFHYAITVALNYKNIKNNPERLTKIKPFFD